ncbi:DEAD-box ATP-dependent RNA helicase [Exophiala xenobiotica]
MGSNQDLPRGVTKTASGFAERFKAKIFAKLRDSEQQVSSPGPRDELLGLSQDRRSQAIEHLAGLVTKQNAESTKFHTDTTPPLPLTGPVNLSGQESVEKYPGADDATDAATNDSDINQYGVDTSDERDNCEMHRRKSNDLGTAHVDQPDCASNGASDDASDESQSLEVITDLDESRLTQSDRVIQPSAHVNQPDEASAIITDQDDSQQWQNARAEYLRTRNIPCGPGHFEYFKASTKQKDSQVQKFVFVLVTEHDLFDFTANHIATHVPGKILVFLPSRAEADTFCNTLRTKVNDRRVEVSHSDHSRAERTEKNNWIHGSPTGILVVCGTCDSAVNIPGLDHTIFVKSPLSLEQFMSASARVGRKGNTGDVSLFSSPEGENPRHQANEVFNFMLVHGHVHGNVATVPITYYHNEHDISRSGFQALMTRVLAATTASPAQFSRPTPAQFSGPPPTQFSGPPPAQFSGPPLAQFSGPPLAQFSGPPTQFQQHSSDANGVWVKLYGRPQNRSHTGWHNLDTGEFRPRV